MQFHPPASPISDILTHSKHVMLKRKLAAAEAKARRNGESANGPWGAAKKLLERVPEVVKCVYLNNVQ